MHTPVDDGHADALSIDGRLLDASPDVDLDQQIALAASDNRQWRNVLIAMRIEFGATAVAWTEHSLARRRVRIADAVGIDAIYLRLHATEFSLQSDWLADAGWYEIGKVSADSAGAQVVRADNGAEVDELVAGAGSPFEARWLQPQALRHRLCGVVASDEHGASCVDVLRSTSHSPFSKANSSRLAELLPALGRALDCNAHLWRLAVLSDVLDGLPHAVIAVDASGRALYANRAAHALRSSERDARYVDEALLPTDATARAKVQALVASVATATSDPTRRTAPEEVVVERSGQGPLRISVVSMGRQLRRGIGQPEEVVLLHIDSNDVSAQLPETLLRGTYGLTPAECRVCRLLVSGHRVESAANELSISVHTARSHLKRIYTKTHASHQADLVRLLLAGPHTNGSLD